MNMSGILWRGVESFFKDDLARVECALRRRDREDIKRLTARTNIAPLLFKHENGKCCPVCPKHVYRFRFRRNWPLRSFFPGLQLGFCFTSHPALVNADEREF